MNDTALKKQVHDYWDKESCGTQHSHSTKFTREYFDEIESHRYLVEPEIFSFAQFTRYHGQKILEVGIGAGSDFIQWVRAGTKAYGIDLTDEAVEHVQNRLAVYGLKAEDVRVGDAENIPFPDESFDLVYSWGVIHHSPDTIRALEEIIRKVRVGGRIKIMIYNRHSLYAFYKYLYFGLLRGKPFRSLAWIMYHYQESPGTKAYTIREVRTILSRYPLRVHQITAPATSYDLLRDKPWPARLAAYVLACLVGYERCGFFLTFEATKTGPFQCAAS